MVYLRRKTRSKRGERYSYWSIVETVRTERGPRQRTIATLGKVPGLDKEERVGWEDITRQLDGKPKAKQLTLFEEEKKPEVPKWASIDLSRVRVERVRRFGDVYLGLALWRRLGLHNFFKEECKFSYVVLPLPDSPPRPKHAPLSIENVTPSTAFSILYFLSITPLATMGKCLTNYCW